MNTFKLLDHSEYPLYITHVQANFKNSRMDDPDLMDKVNDIYREPLLKVFVLMDENSNIKASILTKKKSYCPEYNIINYRTTGDKYFKKQDMLDLFKFVFDYYENIGYYRWLLLRPTNLLGRYFHGLGKDHPFDKYETAIEYAPAIYSNPDFFLHRLLKGIPKAASPNDYLLIVGFCKQEHRKLFSNLNFI